MKRFRLIRRIVLGLLLLVIIAGVIVYFNLNRIVRRTIEVQATDSLNLNTSLNSASLSLFGGKLDLGNMAIASPPGYRAPDIMSFDQARIAVNYGQLRQQPVRISSITIDKPKFVIEQVGGKFNVQSAMEMVPKRSGEPMRLVIDKLTVNNATVILRPGLPGLEKNEIAIPIPSMVLNNIGSDASAQNGAAIKDVVVKVLQAALEQSGKAGNLPDQLKNALQANAQAMSRQIQSEIDTPLKGTGLEGIGKTLGGQIDKNVGGGLDKILGGSKEKK